MTRIGLTQRVEIAPSHGERRDCLDQRWSRLLVAGGFIPVPLPNAIEGVARHVEALALDGLIFTGGNDIASLDGAGDGSSNVAPERDRFERELLAVGSARGLPILGVCRGAQMLSLFHGGAVSRVAGHVARRHAVTRVVNDLPSLAGRLVRRWPTCFEVNSFHTFAIPAGGVGSRVVPLALAEDGSVEAIGHVELPQIGVLWHPERDELPVGGLLDLLRIIFPSIHESDGEERR